MSPQSASISALVAAARRRVLRDGAAAAAAAVAIVIPGVLIVAWLAGGSESWGAPSATPLALELLALAIAAALGGWLARRWLAGYDEGRAAATAETTLGLPAGSVRGVLELGRTVPEGTSPSLFRHAEQRLALRLAGTKPAALTGEAGVAARRRRGRAALAFAGASALALGLGFAAPARTRAAWAPLAHPVSYLTPPPLPALQVRPGNARIARGGSLDVAVVAPRRRWVELHWRAPGDVPRTRELDVSRDAARGRLGAIDELTAYWVTAPDGASSDTFHVTPVDPLLLSDVVLDVTYPAYLRRAAERFDGDVPALELPAGSQIRIRGRGTRPLSAAQLVERGSGMRIMLRTEADRFAATWTPSSSGTYDWALADRAGERLASAPAPLELTIVGDSTPRVDVLVPSADTTLSADMKQPIAATASDDHGLHSASIVSWRASGSGERDAPLEQPLSLGALTDRATLEGVLDATSRRLVPGDTLHFFIRVTDNSPARQSGVSRTLSLRLPGMEELRTQAEREAAALVEQATAVTKSVSGLQEDTRNLERETAASNARAAGSRGGSPDGKGGSPGLSFEKTEQARQVLERQDELVQKVEDLRAQTAQLEKAMRGAGLQDPELQARLRELKQLYDQILTPELRQKLEALRQALAQQDPQQVQKALEELSKQQDAFKKQLDQSLELMRRAAAEQQMNALAQKARELAGQQAALADAMKQQPGQAEQLSQQQKELAQRVDSLSKAIDQMRQRLEQQGETQAAKNTSAAGRQADNARQQMQQAGKQASQRPEDAAQQGKQAADSLSAAAQTLEQTRRSMAESWKQEVQQAVQQATNEALSLAQRQASISKRLREMEQEQQGQTPQQMMQQGQQQSGQEGNQDQQAGRSGQQPQAQQQAGGQQQGAQAGGRQSPQQGGGQRGGKQGEAQGGQNGKGGQKGASGAPQPNGKGSLSALRAEQQALQQSLQQLGKNLAEAGEKSALLNRDVGSALARAMLAMQQAMQAMDQKGSDNDPPTEQADQAVEALNRLALSLATNGQQAGGSESGTGVPQALEQLADLARKQGNINGQTSSLQPLDVAPSALAQQMQGLAQQEKVVAQKLGGMARQGGQDRLLGRLDELSRQADQLARDMSGGRLSEELMRKQQELFHRLLDAGRTLEKDDVSPQRVAESPGSVGATFGKALDPALLQGGLRYALPTPEQLQALPPAYRRMIVEYFERLNRQEAVAK